MNTHVSVKIGGQPHGLQFRSAQIRQSLFAPCQIQVELGFKSPEASSIYDKAASKWLGEQLVITFADKDDKAIEKKYEGVVTSLSLGTDTLSLVAQSEDHLLGVARKHKSWVNVSVSDIVNDIVKASLKDCSVTNPDKSLKFNFLQQYDETDTNFLHRLARYDGCVFYHDGEKFIYAPRMEGGKNVSLKLEHVSDVQMVCTLGLNKWVGAPYDFVKHTDPKNNEKQSGSYTPPPHPFASKTYDKSKSVYKKVEEEIYNEGVINDSQFEQFLTNQQSLAGGKLVKVTGKANHPMVAIGRAIECKDHPILKDKVVVTDILTTFSDIVYSSVFEAVSEKAAIMESKPDARHHLDLLQPAVVVDNKDPEGIGRVQIQYFWDSDGRTFAWARLVHTGAGGSTKAYGTHFIPRVGDHVLIGFENGDPSLPIVFGGLYHSEAKPDFETENGTEEVLLVKTPRESIIRVLDKDGSEEIVVSMKDKKNLIRLELKEPKITVESVDGTILVHSKTIQFNADDKIELNANTIQMSSNQDFKVDAKGNANIKATQNCDIEATGSLNVKSTQGVVVEGTASVTIKNAAAEIAMSGPTVNINHGALEVM
jgi:uncharacterized protein involved in type VI secretion and phage assembly